jgi:hypothetical protein
VVLPPAELHLGRALALIHRVLPRLDEPERAETAEQSLVQVIAEVQAALAAHRSAVELRRAGGVEGEVLALIAAAVAVVLGRPHRVLEVRKASLPVSWVNAWAIEGRFQHYSSHKVR